MSSTDALQKRIELSLQTIHGNEVPLPNRPTPEAYAEMIVRWLPEWAQHQPGDPHQYEIACKVCDQHGTLRVSVDPETAP